MTGSSGFGEAFPPSVVTWFSVEVNGVKYYFLVERIYDRLLTVKNRGAQGDAENNGRRLVRAESGL